MSAVERCPTIHLPNDRRYRLDSSISFSLRRAGEGWTVSMRKAEVDDLDGKIFIQMDIFTYCEKFSEAERLLSALEKLRDSSSKIVFWPGKHYIVR